MDENKVEEAVEETTATEVDPKAEKFRTLANKRVNDACKKIINIGKLANRSSYHYTAEEVEKIFTVMQEQLDFAKAKFSAQKAEAGKSETFIEL